MNKKKTKTKWPFNECNRDWRVCASAGDRSSNLFSQTSNGVALVEIGELRVARGLPHCDSRHLSPSTSIVSPSYKQNKPFLSSLIWISNSKCCLFKCDVEKKLICLLKSTPILLTFLELEHVIRHYNISRTVYLIFSYFNEIPREVSMSRTHLTDKFNPVKDFSKLIAVSVGH